jgi:major membrane immunogen (membrane-anchored lipoprotein)
LWVSEPIFKKCVKQEQDINKIDATSGATWSYNIFKAAVNEALKNAKSETKNP